MNDFQQWFSRATHRFEKALLKLGAVLLLLLFISQFLLTDPTVRNLMSYMVRLEGQEVEEVFSPESPRDLYMELAVDEGGEGSVKVLVNQGEEVSFEGGRVRLNVKEGDLIEIDGRRMQDPVTVRVVAVHDGIRAPLVGHSVTTFGTNELLGWVMTE